MVFILKNHVLNICPRYSEAREKLNKRTCQLLQSADGLAEIFQDEILIKDMAKFTRRCHYIKFPENEGKESAKAPKKKIPHLIKVTIYQEVVTFSSHNQD